MRAAGEEGGGCFPTGRHYPGIAHLLRIVAQGLVDEVDGLSAITDLSFSSIDTETTGTDPAVDRIVEIAVVVWKAGEVSARHRFLLNPGRPISEEAAGIHGITDEHVKDAPPFSAIAAELIRALEGTIPVAYNAEFDKAFLLEEIGRAGIATAALPPPLRRAVEWVDPLVWAREFHKEEKSKALSEVAERLGVKLEKAHSALDDAEAAIHVLGRFLPDPRVPSAYGAFIQEQKRLARMQIEERQYWRNG